MIICCGEALVDMLPDEKGHSPVLGGSIFNTARVCGRLGLDTAYVAPLSTDIYGDRLAQSLSASGVSLEYVRRVDRPTALAWVTLTNGQADYRFEMDGSASQMTTRTELPDSLPSCRLAHFGSISLVSEPCATAYVALLEEISRSAVTSVDPNIRPAFINDIPAQRHRLDHVFSLADIIKLSDEDLAWFDIEATSNECEQFAKRLLTGRTSLVVITRGPDGATGYCNAGRVDVPGVSVKVRDTVGAGDAFSAGLYHGIHHAIGLTRDAIESLTCDTLETILSRASRVSAAVVEQEGAELPAGFELQTEG